MKSFPGTFADSNDETKQRWLRTYRYKDREEKLVDTDLELGIGFAFL